MKKTFTLITLFSICLLSTAQNPLKKKTIYNQMQKVADWQLANFEDQVKTGSRYKDSHAYWAWTNGALYLGMLDWANMSKDDKYIQFLKAIGEKEGYKPGPDVYHADDICVNQTYLELFAKYNDSAMVKPTLERMDYILANRHFGDLEFTRPGNQLRWSWCDALFMAPPAYARAYRITGNIKYLNFMDEEFKVTYDTLYDHAEKLFYRDTRYKTQREANGEKIFWGRGNGWVIGGLCMIIDNIPKNHPTRPMYISLFQEMSADRSQGTFFHEF
jgi:rhamnogalacturonyl hydrolase YesR